MTTSSLPEAGYRINKVYAVAQRHRVVDASEIEISDDNRAVTFGWDWRVLEPPTFEVMLSVTVGPNKAAPDELHYAVVGTFYATPENTMDIEQFVQCNAIATLLPFVREGLVALSHRGPYGTYYLPTINAMRLAKDLNFGESTGVSQLAQNPQLRIGLAAKQLGSGTN